jgi:signal transduction histidine kinase
MQTAMSKQKRIETELVQMIPKREADTTPVAADHFEEMQAQATTCLQNRIQDGASSAEVLSDGHQYGIGTAVSTPEQIRRLPSSILKHSKQQVLNAADGFSMVDPIRRPPYDEPLTSVRSFIGGLSHCYNNLLMGIWGNATLIGMTSDKSEHFQSWLNRLEALIQNSSNLLYLLFGYITERRSAVRKRRLRLLEMELVAYHKVCGEGNELAIIERCIDQWSSNDARPQMAASISQVIDRMQLLLSRKISFFDKALLKSSRAAVHIEKIHALLRRGTKLVHNLQYYAGVRIPIKKPLCLKEMAQHCADEIAQKESCLNLVINNSTPIPQIDADSHQIHYAFDQLLRNAVQAVSEEGKIEIELNTLNSESPQDRCGVHMLRDYAVVTVRDTGKGMTTSFQSKIFEPFFTGIKGQGRSGLGLPAAAGIVRNHGGYIHLRSKAGKGSIFKIYLPIG